MFSYEFCEIFKNTFFLLEHLRWLLLYTSENISKPRFLWHLQVVYVEIDHHHEMD